MAGESDVGTGLILTYGGTFAAEILAVDFDDHEVPIRDISHLGTSAIRLKLAGKLKEPGTLTFEVHWKGDEKPALSTGSRANRLGLSLSILLPDGSTWAWTAAIYQRFSASAPLEDPMTGTVVFQLNSDYTVT